MAGGGSPVGAKGSIRGRVAWPLGGNRRRMRLLLAFPKRMAQAAAVGAVEGGSGKTTGCQNPPAPMPTQTRCGSFLEMSSKTQTLAACALVRQSVFRSIFKVGPMLPAIERMEAS